MYTYCHNGIKNASGKLSKTGDKKSSPQGGASQAVSNHAQGELDYLLYSTSLDCFFSFMPGLVVLERQVELLERLKVDGRFVNHVFMLA